MERLILQARAALAWESLWHCVAAALTAAALFASLAWLGLLQDRPTAWRIVALIASVALGAVLAWRGFAGRALTSLWPGRGKALARIDRDSDFSHGDATAYEDSLSNGASDPATTALWRVHRARLATALDQAKVGLPHPQVARADVFALRAGLLVLFVASAAVAGDERDARLVGALSFDAGPGASAAATRLDAWIDPPAYTGRAPIILLGSAATPNTADIARDPVSAPVNSVVVVRASDPSGLSIETEGAIAKAAAPDPRSPEKAAAKPDGSQRFVIRGDGRLTFHLGHATAARFGFVAIPDKPPTIALVGAPKANARGSLSLTYRTTDDYGVIGVDADFSAPEIDGKPVTGRTLVAPPRAALALPNDPNGIGEGTSTVDLSDHPWAGARVTMVIHARDEGGNEGASEPQAVVLPQHRFVKPLARALVEQRRNLVLDPDHRDRVHSALEGLMIAPDAFQTPSGVYLGLHVASERLLHAQDDAALLDVAAFLWQMALQIEDGDLSETERDLRAAQNQLRDALSRNAPEDEIRKLTENLRAAMDKFLAEMAARQQREDADQSGEPDKNQSRNSRMVSRDDLKAMMDRIEEMARSGNMADAQRMLEQMQNILENLRTAKKRSRNPAQQEMSRALDELDAMTREQQQLRDDTFRGKQSRKGKQGQRRQQQPGAGTQPDDDQTDDNDDAQNGDDQTGGPQDQALQRRQKVLRDRLGELQKRLDRLGPQRDKGFGDAGDAMKDAEEALGDDQDGDKGGQPGEQGPPGEQGRPGGKKGGRGAAVDAQGRALEALRQGAQSLAQQMQQSGNGQGEGEDDASSDADGDGDPQGGQPRQAEGGRDPLGRPTSRDPLYNPRSRYDPMGASPALRAQRVLEELRRRLGETARPTEELDYLERLLRRY